MRKLLAPMDVAVGQLKRCRARTAVLFLSGIAACADPGGAPFNDSITEAALRADLYALAHDSTRGRLVGTPEIARASDWVRGRFDALGLEPAGDDAAFDQRFDLMWFSLGEGNLLTVSGAGQARRPGEDWYPLNFSATTSATGEVVFAGFGIVEPRLQYDDYGTADIRGKIVLVLEREPGVDDAASPFDGVVTAEASRDWRKALAAQNRGAAGILFVRDIHNRNDITDWQQAANDYWPKEPRRIERFALSAWIQEITIPGAFISTALADKLLAGSGATLNELAEAADAAPNGLGVKPLPGTRVTLTTAIERHITPARNILGMITGSDPVLRDEVVMVIGHHDHNGAAGDTVYNGADDNASGAVGVMAVAAAYARAAARGVKPRRSVLFAITDAEERGPSLGAWHLTLEPRFPLTSTVAVFNVDMIGRNQEVPENGGGRFNGLEVQTAESNANAVNILGYSRAPELAAAVESANSVTALTLRLRYDNNESNLLRRSDQWPYLQNDVPAVWFHTGLHPDYHTPDDDADRINYEKMTRIVRLIHQVSWNVANADTRPGGVTPMGSRPPS
jgi:hypothetical protein